ncbi:Gfo/Idh/MocA family oxidoreductase [Ferruginibacter paludis]|uniref:Gfo/Idh/MocA family protein n=1 Tax=Ferruginibacter paludis TaxID=1310417 RepID=UPI0025B2DB2B|nr:Gfo/Idh/MocA family oxidoreductase [Ferruginibacter paludis]MDN3655507.1 Gfo/Idh/MocA family oxidoreductase [Ferruginibacter paludis]
MIKRNYRWGILGAGRIAEKFCTALSETGGSEVYAVASRDAGKADAYAAKFNASVVFTDYNALVKDANVDIIYIATPHAFHYNQTMLCLQHNKPVLCEKPMSLSPKQTAEMIAAATKSNLFLMEGVWTRCMPFIEKTLSLIKEGVIGEPQYLQADFGFFAAFDPASRLFDKALGGGSVMDIGIYPIFLAALIFGEPSVIKSVFKLAETGVDTYASILLQYPAGESAHLLSTIDFNTPIEATIIGTKGRIQIHNPWFKATAITVHLNDGTQQDFDMPHQSNGFEHEIKEVMYCLDNGLLQSPKVPHQLTLLISKIMDEVLQQAGVNY